VVVRRLHALTSPRSGHATVRLDWTARIECSINSAGLRVIAGLTDVQPYCRVRPLRSHWRIAYGRKSLLQPIGTPLNHVPCH
jgi:hypothetical protein